MDGVKLEGVDVRIIQSLHENPRISMVAIARRLGQPESTIRHRFNRLVQLGVIEFAALANPLRFGYRIWVMIEIQAELPKVRAVAHRLAALPEVYFVGISTGNYDVFASAVFRSNEELLDFITGRLARIPGIVRTSTSSILQLVKRSLTFGLPAEFARNERPFRKNRAAKRKRQMAG